MGRQQLGADDPRNQPCTALRARARVRRSRPAAGVVRRRRRVRRLVLGHLDLECRQLDAANHGAAAAGPVFYPLASDSNRGRIVLFGGEDLSRNRLDGTWEWTGTAWSQRIGLFGPSPRRDAAHGV